MIESITDEEIKIGKEVLLSHTVTPLTSEGALECLLWCIASQASPWEQASNFAFNLRRESYPEEGEKALEKYASWKLLTSKEKVNQIARRSGFRFSYQNRFDGSIDYFNEREKELVTINESTNKERELYVNNIPFLGHKTFSFWHLCLGGQNLIALDVHVMRGLKKDFGIDLPIGYFESIERGNGSKHPQKVRKTPSKSKYVKLEQEAKEFFSQDFRLYKDGELDLGLVDSILWWRGARRDNLGQGQLFEFDHQVKMPYGFLNGKANGKYK